MNPLKNKYSLLLCLLLCSHASLSFAELADREKPMNMEADRVVVDDVNQISTFEGNVQMRQGTLFIEATKIVVTQDKKGFNQMTATGQLAHFRQKRDGVNEYAEGFGERIVYDTLTETADFFGQARVKRDGDEVSGEHIIYNTKTGVFQVFGATVKNPDTPNQGRVRIIIQPKDQPKVTAPNAQPLPIKPSTTLTAPKQ
jgi:lipopolysaccharide export system protein LptA